MMYSPPPQPIFFRDSEVTRVAPDKIAEQPAQEGHVRVRRRRRSLLPDARWSSPRSGPRRLRAARGARADRPARSALRVVGARASPHRRSRTAFFAGPKDFDVLAAVDRDLVRAIDFGMFAVARRAAAARAEVDQRLRRQLRLVDHPADGADQPGDVPAAAQERRLDAQDAGRCSRR